MVLGMARLSQRWNWHGALAPPIHRSLHCTRPSPRNPSSFRRHRTEVLLSTSSACRKRTSCSEYLFLVLGQRSPSFCAWRGFCRNTCFPFCGGSPSCKRGFCRMMAWLLSQDTEGKRKKLKGATSLFCGLRRSRGEFQLSFF